MPLPDPRTLDKCLEARGFTPKTVLLYARGYFAQFDGKVCASNLKDILVEMRKSEDPSAPSLTEAQLNACVQAAMRDLDKDKTGCLNFEEFCTLIKLFVIQSRDRSKQPPPNSPNESNPNESSSGSQGDHKTLSRRARIGTHGRFTQRNTNSSMEVNHSLPDRKDMPLRRPRQRGTPPLPKRRPRKPTPTPSKPPTRKLSKCIKMKAEHLWMASKSLSYNSASRPSSRSSVQSSRRGDRSTV
uniref:EF-hand domain-containing protein n=1 Tax=Lotharella oceanica TaxID=641309 RepID=A0A7S2TJE6_9EUKA|mmetsp:Transcript_16984/g.32231  ORF Transcript_16984/g.32231 Transcript_16984/m.32231 type:complete len:242 (+) Transcript_16984:177-902(+)